MPRPLAPRLILFAAALAWLPLAARAQVLQGDWVDKSQKRIAEGRRRDLRVIVLGRDDKPAANATVHIQQQRHAFTLGIIAPAEGLPSGFTDAPSLPFWQIINAVSLERVGDWSHVQPRENKPPDYAAVDQVVKRARRRNWKVRWGPVVSEDPAHNPDWVAGLDAAGLHKAVWDRLDSVMGRYGHRIIGFDVVADGLDHTMLEDQLGDRVVSRLYNRARAIAPDTTLCLRCDDVLDVTRVGKAFAATQKAREAFMPFDCVALTQHIRGTLVQGEVQRVVSRLDAMRSNITISHLEVDGPTPTGAAINMETLLRTLFASPRIRGIYLDAVTPDQAADSDAALLDDQGHPTAVGKLIAALFGKLWWTSMTARTDELGNVKSRVFAGAYTITATLPDGTTMSTDAWVGLAPHASSDRVVVLAPLATDRSAKPKP